MHDALDWLASWFPKYGVIAICLAAVFGVFGLVARAIGSPLTVPVAAWLFKLAGLSFAAFVLMAIFYAFRL